MNIIKTYRGKTSTVKTVDLRVWDSGINYTSHNYKGSVYRLEIPISDYLSVAKKACKGLEKVSGMEYRVMSKHPNSNQWRSL